MKEMSEIASEMDQKAKEKYKLLYDKWTKSRSFQVGDMALVLMPEGHSKLEASYLGPLTIMEK